MNIFTRIKALHLPKHQFIVMGSANMEVKGIRKAHDLDIMVASDVFERMPNDWTHRTAIGKSEEFKEWLEKPDVEMHRLCVRFGETWNMDYFLRNPWRIEEINGILFSSLPHLVAVKRLYNRDKHWKDIELIKQGVKDSNLCMAESKSATLPLG